MPQAGLPDNEFNKQKFGISQTFVIAGQAGHRREAASMELAAVMANIDEIRQQVHAEVEQRFYRVLVLQRRIETEREVLTAIDAAATAVRRRVAVGEDSRLDVNLATVEAERGRNQLAVLGEQLLQAKAELAATLQLPDAALPEASGELRAALPTTNLDTLLAAAWERPLLRVLEQREQASRKRLARIFHQPLNQG